MNDINTTKSKTRSTRKKSYKKMSFDELIKEKEAALAVIDELRDMAMNTLLEIEELTKKLNVVPAPLSISKSVNIDPTSKQFTYTPPSKASYTSDNFYTQDREEEEEDEKQVLEFGAINSSDGGNMSPSIKLIDPEEILGFRQYQS